MLVRYFSFCLLILAIFSLLSPPKTFATSNPIQKIILKNLENRYSQLENNEQKLLYKLNQSTEPSQFGQIIRQKLQENQDLKQGFQVILKQYSEAPSLSIYIQLQSDLKQLRQNQLDLIKVLSNKQQPSVKQSKKTGQKD
jgi:predicted nucleotidyltransferase